MSTEPSEKQLIRNATLAALEAMSIGEELPDTEPGQDTFDIAYALLSISREEASPEAVVKWLAAIKGHPKAMSYIRKGEPDLLVQATQAKALANAILDDIESPNWFSKVGKEYYEDTNLADHVRAIINGSAVNAHEVALSKVVYDRLSTDLQNAAKFDDKSKTPLPKLTFATTSLLLEVKEVLTAAARVSLSGTPTEANLERVETFKKDVGAIRQLLADYDIDSLALTHSVMYRTQ